MPDRSGAQGVQVFELAYGLYPASSFQDAGGPEQAGLDDLELTLDVPVVFSKDKSYLLNKLKYERLHVRYEDLASGDPLRTLHSLKYEGIFSVELRPSWWLALDGSLELASDFKSVSLGDVQPQGAAVLTKNLRDNLVLGGGIALTNSSGEPRLVPVLYFRHTSECCRSELIFPDSATFYYTVGRGVRLGLEAHYRGKRFRLEHDLEARSSVITLGPSVEWRFVRPLSVSVEAGAALDRRFDGFVDPARDGLPDHLEAGLYVKAALQAWVGGH
jgi:uncharacterized protein DUF6268